MMIRIISYYIKEEINAGTKRVVGILAEGELKLARTLRKAVLREVKEEYGVKGTIEKQLPAHSLLREENGVKTHWLIITFVLKVDRKKVVNNDPKKIAELGWFKLDNLPKTLHTRAQYTLGHYKEEFKKYL